MISRWQTTVPKKKKTLRGLAPISKQVRAMAEAKGPRVRSSRGFLQRGARSRLPVSEGGFKAPSKLSWEEAKAGTVKKYQEMEAQGKQPPSGSKFPWWRKKEQGIIDKSRAT